MAETVRALISAIGATRYLISTLVLAIAITYDLLARTGAIPAPAVLMAPLHLPGSALYILLYLFLTIFGAVIWYLLVLIPGTSLATRIEWRSVYQQTDPAGLRGLNMLLLLVILGGVIFSQSLFREEHLRATMLWLAVIFALPVLFDFLPPRRPHRAVIPYAGRTVNDVALRLLRAQQQALSPDAVVKALYAYNTEHFERHAPDCRDDPDSPLPDGMVLDIPPDFR